MAGPITWQNISGDTGVRDASNALVNASRSFNTGLGDITQAIEGQRDSQLGNLKQQNTSNRNLLEDAINRFGTAAELKAAQENGDIQNLLNSLGPNVKSTGLNDLITNRIDTLTSRENAEAKRAGADIADQITGLLADGKFDVASAIRADNLDVLDQANMLGATSQEFKNSLLARQKATGSKVQDQYNSLINEGKFTEAEDFRTKNSKALGDAGLLDDTARYGKEVFRQDQEYQRRQEGLKASEEADSLVRSNIKRTLERQQVK